MSYSIAIIDDHPIVRDGLASVIGAMEDFTITMNASNGREFIDMLSGNENPSIAIIDLNMPVMNGYETITWLAERHPDIHSLALTLDDSDDAMAKAIRCGARGFIRKNERAKVLKLALRTLGETGYYHSEAMHRTMMQNPNLNTTEEKNKAKVLSQITERQMEFLALVCSREEYTYEEIADIMNIRRRTVDYYRKELFEKFSIKSKTGLVLFALQWKIAGL